MIQIRRHNKKKLHRDLTNCKVYQNLDGSSHTNTENWEYQPQPVAITTANNNVVNDPKKNTQGNKKRRYKKNTNISKKKRVTKNKLNRTNLKNDNSLRKNNSKPTIPTTIDPTKYYLNLSTITIGKDEEYVFYLCQKYCPTPLKVDWSKFETDIDNWSYMLRWAYIYIQTKQRVRRINPPGD